MFFIKATLKSGEVVICEFQKPQSMRRFAQSILSGQKALPVWRTVGNVHPVSGEPTLMRSREFISGSDVSRLQAVVPSGPFDDTQELNPALFVPHAELKNQGNGFWTNPDEGREDFVTGIPAGARFAVKRDASDGRRYVTLRVAEGVEPEQRHYLDMERAGVSAPYGRDDEDIDWDDDDGDDE